MPPLFRRKIVPLTFSVFIFLACLATVEIFFQLNKKYQWLEPKSAFAGYQFVDPEHKIPPELIAEANRRFPHARYTPEKFNELNNPANKLVHQYTPKIFFSSYIRENRNNHRAFELHQKSYVNDELIIDTRYKITADHTRHTENYTPSEKNKNFLFLGCSYAFGHGVQDGETIPSFIAEQRPQYNYYNLGVPNGSITNILSDIHHGDRIKNISKAGGVVVYMYWQDHFRRHFSDLGTLRDNYPSIDDLIFDVRDGELHAERKDSLKNKTLFFLKKLLSRSEFLYFYGWGYNTFSISYQKKFIDSLVFIRDYYRDHYNLDFYLFVISQYDIPSPAFYQMLKDRQIKLILYENTHDYIPNHEGVIPRDQHFTAKLNYLFSLIISKQLNETQSPSP